MTRTSGWIAFAFSRILSRFVSQSRRRSLPETLSLSLRNLTCTALSSPLTYKALTPALAMVASVCSTSVDFPIPGSPPIKTREPGAKPPPSVLSNSGLAELNLFAAVVSMSASFRGTPESPSVSRLLWPSPRRVALLSTGRSTRLDHAPQCGHLPAHLEVTSPHSLQKNSVSFLAML